MPIISSRVTVTTARTLVVNPTRGGVPDPISGIIRNAGGVSCFLGGELNEDTSTLSAAEGFELAPGESQAMDLVAGDVLYAICASGSTELHVMRFRQ